MSAAVEERGAASVPSSSHAALTLHPRQRPLELELEEVWISAVTDAGFEAEGSLLYAFAGQKSASGYSAWHFNRGLEIERDSETPEFDDDLLAEMNSEECIGAVRIVVWTERQIEALAGVMRHELEHQRQVDVVGAAIYDLYNLCVSVLAERVEGLPGGGVHYGMIPIELDANAASAMFVRERYGGARVHELLAAGSGDASLFRSLVPPPDPSWLPERMLAFLISHRDLCERHAERHDMAFSEILNLHWGGAGAVWTRLVSEKVLSLLR